MPCQSYDSSWDNGSDERKIRELKKQADMLARIACKALAELENNKIEDMLLLKDDEVRTWWAKHKEDDRKAKEALLLPREQVEKAWANAVAISRTKLLALPTRARQRIPHLSLEEVALIEELVRETLHDLSSGE